MLFVVGSRVKKIVTYIEVESGLSANSHKKIFVLGYGSWNWGLDHSIIDKFERKEVHIGEYQLLMKQKEQLGVVWSKHHAKNYLDHPRDTQT